MRAQAEPDEAPPERSGGLGGARGRSRSVPPLRRRREPAARLAVLREEPLAEVGVRGLVAVAGGEERVALVLRRVRRVERLELVSDLRRAGGAADARTATELLAELLARRLGARGEEGEDEGGEEAAHRGRRGSPAGPPASTDRGDTRPFGPRAPPI